MIHSNTSTLVLLYLFLILNLSCFEEDILPPLPPDNGLIIGKWEGHNGHLVYLDGSEVFWNEDNNCYGFIMEFFEDGTLWFTDFINKPEENLSCYDDPETNKIGNWNRISNGKYEFILTRSSDDSELLITPELIEFIDYNNGIIIMKIHYNEPPEGAPENAVSINISLSKE